MKKGINRWFGLLLIVSLMLCNGCSLLLLNQMKQQEEHPGIEIDVPENEDGQKDQTADHQEQEDGQKDASAGNNKAEDEEKDNQGSSGSSTSDDSALMTDFFKSKLELLEYVIDLYYMGEFSTSDLQDGAYKGLLSGLGDPYSVYYTAKEYQDLMESTSGTYAGIGAVVQQDVRTMLITVVKPYVDCPAYNAGMLPGDIIYMVNDIDVTGMEVDKVVTMMKGTPGTKVKVTVIRDGEADPVELVITRAMIEIESVEYEMLDYNIGYVGVSSFDEPTPSQFKEAIVNLKKDGMEGLVIDLRNNGGGLLSAVVEMLDYILPEGMIVYTEDKYGNRDEFKGTNKDVLYMPIVVLINGNSASASEIFAAAIQDYDAGTIIGTTSFGKGIVQSIVPFTDGTAVKLTVSHYYTPKGVCIHGVGVIPDIEVDLAEELKQKVVIERKEDNQLQVAIAQLISEIKK